MRLNEEDNKHSKTNATSNLKIGFCRSIRDEFSAYFNTTQATIQEFHTFARDKINLDLSTNP